MRGITFPSAFSWGDLFEEGGRAGKRVVRMEYSIVHMELVSQYGGYYFENMGKRVLF